MPSKKQSEKNDKKELPSLKFNCKFRGKYDINKHKTNKNLDIENARNLFEVIYKKNEKLFRETRIKMFRKQMMFTFGDKKTIRTISHHVPFSQVAKFFIFQKDTKTVFVAVHHKTHKWFLVFQFRTEEDVTAFCDEIEGVKKKMPEQTEEPTTNVVDNEGMTNVVDTNNYEIHEPFDDSFYTPEIELEVENRVLAEESLPMQMSSDRTSTDSNDSEFHCDDLGRSKLSELYINDRKRMYNTNEVAWKEELTCIDYPSETNNVTMNRNGPIYMYSAHQVAHEISEMQMKSGYCSDSDSDSDDDRRVEGQFTAYKTKLVSSQEQSYHTEIIYDNNQEENSKNYQYEPKMVYLN